MLDDTGAVVGVSERGVLTGVPYRVTVNGRPPRRLLSWAGPWPVEERWWEPGEGRRCIRVQAVLDAEPSLRDGSDEGSGPPNERSELFADTWEHWNKGSDGGRGDTEPIAVLLTHTEGRWQVEGIYE